MPLQIPLPTADPYTDIAQYVPLLISSIEGFLQARDVWATADYQQAYSYMEDLKAYLVETLPPVNDAFQTYFTHFHSNSKVTFGNALSPIINTGQVHNYLARQNPAANGDSFEFEVPLKAGNYNLVICGAKSSGQGKLSVARDGDALALIDFYAASTTLNVSEIVSLPVATDHKVKINCFVFGKNAASSGYVVNITYFAISPE